MREQVVVACEVKNPLQYSNTKEPPYIPLLVAGSNHLNYCSSKDTSLKDAKDPRNSLELVKSASDKHLDLLRPSARYYSIFRGQEAECDEGKYTLIIDPENFQQGIYDKPLPCFGCGIGWFSFLLGIICPFLWYYAAALYLGNYYRKDPRERAGLAASAVAALGCSIAIALTAAILLLKWCWSP